MAKKRRVRIDRIIILALAFLLIVIVAGLGIYKLIDILNNSEKPVNDNTHVVTTDGVKVSKVDQSVYYDDNKNLGFNFIVAKLNFNGNKAVSFDLNNLQTSEKISLGNCSSYFDKLKAQGYDLGKLNIVTSVVSDQTSVDAVILIPYTTDSSSLAIYNSVDNTKIEFDLNEKKIAATSLRLSKDENQTIEVGSTSVAVSNIYLSSTILHNGERCNLGSTEKIYTFEISVLEAQDKVTITDASFLIDGSNEEADLLNSEYQPIESKNILNQNLTLGNTGVLLFSVYQKNSDIQSGTLLIKFSNSNDWVEIETD